MSKIFDFDNYQQFLKYWANLSRGNVAILAKVAKCQPSYISRAMSEEVQLTQDHAHALCAFWQFNSLEREFFMALLDYDRAGTIELKKHLKDKILKIRSNHQQLKNQVNREAPPRNQSDISFHSHWAKLAIHALTDCKTLNTAESIAQKLTLDVNFVAAILNELENKQLVLRRPDGSYIYNSAPTHIPRDSPILPLFLQSWRQRAIMNSYILNEEHIHFTNVQTISKNDFQKVRKMLMSVIRESSEIANHSNPEDLMVLNCDLFSL